MPDSSPCGTQNTTSCRQWPTARKLTAHQAGHAPQRIVVSEQECWRVCNLHPGRPASASIAEGSQKCEEQPALPVRKRGGAQRCTFAARVRLWTETVVAPSANCKDGVQALSASQTNSTSCCFFANRHRESGHPPVLICFAHTQTWQARLQNGLGPCNASVRRF
jgi:hypothetical protein